MKKEKMREIVEDALDALAYKLMDEDDRVTGTMAVTNASAYELSEKIIEEVEYDKESKGIKFEAKLLLSGEQDEDRPFCGNKIDVQLSGIIIDNEVDQYSVEACDVKDWE